ncbi:MAG: HAMP domain-containing protein, partial [Desulfobulbaceae bacterium]|nr:HAMP domain-containing protein [Desulfobulbaceae bacterium]
FLSLWLPARKADRLKERIIISVGGAALMGIFAMAAAAYLIITRPVEELVQVTRKVAAWDLGQRAVVRSRDEIGLLADSFNQMIHRLREYEERLVESEKMAAAGQIAAGLAHEVRNPLTSIKMFVQVLHGRMEKHSENRDMLTALVQEINRLDRIIQRIVDRARPGELHRQQADIHEHLKNVLQLAAETLISGNISVALRLEARPAMVYADIEKIKQVFWNLVINSMEAMPGGGNLTISTRSGSDGITILFEDTGSGLGVEDPEQFFASFSTKPEGMGLGLSMSRRIIEKHGGALSLKNRKQGGAVACIILPTDTQPTDNREV